MIKKHIISRTSAVICAAAAIACCPMANAAEPYTDAVQEPLSAAAQAESYNSAPEVITVTDYYDYGYDYYGPDYDYHYDHYERYENKNGKKDWLKIILVALGVSLAITGITVFIIYRGYKYNGMTEPYEYKNKAGLELAVRDDQLVDVHVTSVHINRDHS